VISLRALAPAKVNLCLYLGGVRDDGRHELVTLFESLSLCDELELRFGDERDRVICADVPDENLVGRALAALRSSGWDAPPLTVTINKRIPIAAGMAGGSADAAAALRLAVAVTPSLGAVVGEVAASLGSDVPAQLEPGLSIGTGAGEIVSPQAPLGSHAFVIVPSPERLSTAEVYREADRLGLGRPSLSALRDGLRDAVRAGATLPSELMVNDLEPAALSLCPSIASAIADVRAAGAAQALVCGSGPTVAGIFWGEGASARALDAARALAPSHPGTLAASPVDAPFGAAALSSGTIASP
jgi:4-diphosphocytidyl-2-C-methyl-D-erythritol kinase